MDERSEALWRAAGGTHGPTGRPVRRRPWWLLAVAGGVVLALALAYAVARLQDSSDKAGTTLGHLQHQLHQAEAQRDRLLSTVQDNSRVVRQLVARIRQLEAALADAGVPVPAPNAASGGAHGPAGDRGPPGQPGHDGPPGPTPQPSPAPSPQPSPTPRPSPTRCTLTNPVTGKCLLRGLASPATGAGGGAARWRWWLWAPAL